MAVTKNQQLNRPDKYNPYAGGQMQGQLQHNAADYTRGAQNGQLQQQAQSYTKGTQGVGATVQQNAQKGNVNIQPAQTYAYGQNPGEYKNRYGTLMDNILNQITNRQKFKYEFNSDPLWKAYEQQYVQHGKQAMMDTMGQAQGMTGGYGNSYAQGVGQQAYQQYMIDLYDKGLDIRDRAYQLNQDELANLYNLYNLYAGAESQDYERWKNAYEAWLAGQQASGGSGGSGGNGGNQTTNPVAQGIAAGASNVANAAGNINPLALGFVTGAGNAANNAGVNPVAYGTAQGGYNTSKTYENNVRNIQGNSGNNKNLLKYPADIGYYYGWKRNK